MEAAMKKRGFISWYLQYLSEELKRLRGLHKIATRNPTVKIGENVQILNRKKLFLGNHIHISKGTILHCGGGAWCNEGGKITIGDHVYIGPYGIFFGAGEIDIQRRCQFGPRVMVIAQSIDPKVRDDPDLLDQDVPPHKFGKITLEEGVLVGAGSIILEGITIGHDTVISAGSIIQKDIPPNSYVITGKTSKIIDKKSPIFRPR